MLTNSFKLWIYRLRHSVFMAGSGKIFECAIINLVLKCADHRNLLYGKHENKLGTM